MSWNHRVVLRKYSGSVEEHMYEIHECYYDEPGEAAPATSCTLDPIDACGETLEELRETLVRMLFATYKPVLNFAAIGTKYDASGAKKTE